MTSTALLQKSTSRPQMLCPHCQQSNLQIRSSNYEHPLLKTIYFQCRNVLCGFTCGGILEITHEISPSAMPSLNIQLKTLKELAALRATNDEHIEETDG